MINEIYHDCDLITGEVITPFSGGIFDQVRRSNVTVYTSQFGMKELRKAIAQLDGNDPYRDYINYEMFPHLKRMKTFIDLHQTMEVGVYSNYYSWLEKISKPHPLDEMLYQHGREFDRKVLKRVNAFIEAEQELMYSY
jgi:hypothetical protein